MYDSSRCSREIGYHGVQGFLTCGNRSRLYPSCEPCGATVRAASSDLAVLVVGVPVGDGAGAGAESVRRGCSKRMVKTKRGCMVSDTMRSRISRSV